jgi:hypothetical protein
MKGIMENYFVSLAKGKEKKKKRIAVLSLLPLTYQK